MGTIVGAVLRCRVVVSHGGLGENEKALSRGRRLLCFRQDRLSRWIRERRWCALDQRHGVAMLPDKRANDRRNKKRYGDRNKANKSRGQHGFWSHNFKHRHIRVFPQARRGEQPPRIVQSLPFARIAKSLPIDSCAAEASKTLDVPPIPRR